MDTSNKLAHKEDIGNSANKKLTNQIVVEMMNDFRENYLNLPEEWRNFKSFAEGNRPKYIAKIVLHFEDESHPFTNWEADEYNKVDVMTSVYWSAIMNLADVINESIKLPTKQEIKKAKKIKH